MRLQFSFSMWLLIALLACASGSLPTTLTSSIQAQDAEGGFGEEPAAEAPAAEEVPAEETPAEEAPAEEMPAEEPAEDAGAMAEEPAADEVPAEEMPAEGEEPVEGEEAPAAPRAKPKPKVDLDEAADAPIVPLHPAVQAVLESHPKTPFELLQAIRILADLKQAQLAEPFVETLKKQKLDQTAKAAIVSRFHSAALIKLARNPELSASLGPFIDDLLKNAEGYRRDEKRLVEWTKQLSDSNESLRAQAALALLRAREASVAPLVSILSDPARVKERPVAKQMLRQLDDFAIQPLLGVLESPDPALRAQVVEVLGQLKATDAVAHLLAPLISPSSSPELKAACATALKRISGHTPTTDEALRLLTHAATRSLEQSRSELGDGEPGGELWHWNLKSKRSLPASYDLTGAALSNAVQLSQQLHQLDPSNPVYTRLYLTALLQSAKLRGGLGKPLATGAGTAQSLATAAGPELVEQVLTEAMTKGYLPAATGAAEVLGEIGTLDMLARGGATPAPLVRAASHSDRRLRFAALRAIMNLNPTEPFAGSSHVSEGLAFLASSYGEPRILIAHPLSAEASKIAGLAHGLGYTADTATDGRDAFDLAVRSPDYEFILIHSAIAKPQADELLAQLRRDRRTALLPVGFIAPLESLERMENFARQTPRTEAFLQPQKDSEMKLFTSNLLTRAGRSHVGHAERREQAIAALDWIVALGNRPQKVIDVRTLEPTVLPLLSVPELSAKAAEVLADSATDKGQRALLDIADAGAQSVEMRRAAVAAFARSVRRSGILLSGEEIRRQYDLYNANGGKHGDTHEVLGAVLDVIEHKGDAAEKEGTPKQESAEPKQENAGTESPQQELENAEQ